MEQHSERRHWGTVIIGAGQAGLAAAYYLKQRKDDFVILHTDTRTGDSWRKRWDSLRLFTPSQHDGLPGMRFPAASGTLPTKDEVAVYLERYAEHFAFAVIGGVRVTGLTRDQDGYRLVTTKGEFTADRVIVATGTNPVPAIPSFAADLRPDIIQIHSSEYINPASLPEGQALVVGAGTSGVEIAIELAATRPTMLSGKPTPHIPDALFKYAGGPYWWFVSNIITLKTPIGRKAQKAIRSKGAPLIGVASAEVASAGVACVPRVKNVVQGLPVLEDGTVVNPASVVWCTGFRPDYSWIDIPDVCGEDGWLRTDRGVTAVPGLYAIGMVFQYGLTSGLIGGVGRDAEWLVTHMDLPRAA